MTMHDAMGDLVVFPDQGFGAGHQDLALRVEQVVLDERIARVDHLPTVHAKRIDIDVRCQNLGGHRPHALCILLQGKLPGGLQAE